MKVLQQYLPVRVVFGEGSILKLGELAKEYDWCEIKCIKDNEIRTIDDIHEEIFEEVRKILKED